MTEKQNNKNKQYNKVIDAMKTIKNFCNDTPCSECPFNKIGVCELFTGEMGVPGSWNIPRKRKVVQTQEDDPRINPYTCDLRRIAKVEDEMCKENKNEK